ncbi:MAG: twin-arginine translocase subunit TatC, partial [Thermoplasmatales archaeon]|nr:twin-arginine translocase subunit TatC [Thermoplasmatales archaeon]
WRYAVIGALIYGMIFSPGVLGFTMMLMALPMMLLYFSGIYFARRYERNAKIKESEPVPESL